VVERSTHEVDAADPLAGTGFYDDDSATEDIVVRNAFRLGFLPTPQGLFDKHMISVSSILAATWGLWLIAWRVRRRRRVPRLRP
jgi:hypothetical protein